MKREQKYYYSIDLFRGLASIGILIWHYHHFYWQGAPLFPTTIYPTQPFYEFFKPFYHYGEFLVKFFWILSGFVFAFVYLKKNISFKAFFIYRFARLYPLHIITFLVIAFLQSINYSIFNYYQIMGTNDLYHAILQIFFASYWGFQSNFSFNSPTWSISVEILIYALFFLSLKYLNNKPFFTTLISMFTLLFISFYLEVGQHWIAQCGFFFYFGILVFLISNTFEHNPKIILFYAIGFTILAFLCFKLIAFFNHPYILLLFHLQLISTMSLLFSALLLFLAWIDIKNYSKIFSYPFRWIGNTTYSIYLWHLPIQVAILFILDSYHIERSIFDYKITWILWIGFMILIGRLSYLYIEKPLKNIIKEKYLTSNKRELS